MSIHSNTFTSRKVIQSNQKYLLLLFDVNYESSRQKQKNILQTGYRSV